MKKAKQLPRVMRLLVQFLLLGLGIGALCVPIWSRLACQGTTCQYTSGSVVYFRQSESFDLKRVEKIYFEQDNFKGGQSYPIFLKVHGQHLRIRTFHDKQEAQNLVQELTTIQSTPQLGVIDIATDGTPYCIFVSIIAFFALIDFRKKPKPKQKAKNRKLSVVPATAIKAGEA